MARCSARASALSVALLLFSCRRAPTIQADHGDAAPKPMCGLAVRVVGVVTLSEGCRTQVNESVLVEGKLVVEPGVTISFAPGTALVVQGGLDARGRADAPILLQSSSGEPKPGDYRGLVIARFEKAHGTPEAVVISHVTVRHAGAASEAGSDAVAVDVRRAAVVDHLHVEEALGVGLRIASDLDALTHVEVMGAGGAAALTTTTLGHTTGSVFHGAVTILPGAGSGTLRWPDRLNVELPQGLNLTSGLLSIGAHSKLVFGLGAGATLSAGKLVAVDVDFGTRESSWNGFSAWGTSELDLERCTIRRATHYGGREKRPKPVAAILLEGPTKRRIRDTTFVDLPGPALRADDCAPWADPTLGLSLTGTTPGPLCVPMATYPL